MTDRLSRDSVYLRIASILAFRSTCTRKQVGCVLTDKEGKVLATGYNGVPSGWTHCIDVPCKGANSPSGTNLEHCEAIHAEQNALLQCPNTNDIQTCYVTHSPCLHCVKLLLNTGCSRIVFDIDYPHHESYDLWKKSNGEWIKKRPLL